MAGPALAFTKAAGLTIDWIDPAATISRLAVVLQEPSVFDFPLTDWPAQFHHAGPLIDDDGRAEILFPWERLTGERLIYASLGTLVNRQPHLLAAIALGAAALPGTQLVLVTDVALDPTVLVRLPANAIVVPRAPQVRLLRQATLCVTHAGLNTVLEALVAGVPLAAIPIAYEQPGIAARIAHHGMGDFVGFEEATPERVGTLMGTVLQDGGYRERAFCLGAAIAQLDGLGIAADVIERAFDGRHSSSDA